MTLRDGAGRNINYLRLSITDRCNLRCTYCMPEEGFELCDIKDILSLEEFALASEKLSRLFGINKIRLTGGEPLVKRNVEFLIEKLASNPGITDLAITTNGVLLTEKGQNIYDAGMRRLNVSIDTLNPDRFNSLTRFGKLEDSINGINLAKKIGFSPIKINTVLLPGFDEEAELIEWGNSEGFVVRFIELMQGQPTSIDVINDEAPQMPDIIKRLEKKFGTVENVVDNSIDPGKHTVKFRIPSKDWSFEIIPAITNHFCNHCNRIRLNCKGDLRFCLYSDQTLNIRGLLQKSDEEFMDGIRNFVNQKSARGSDHIASYMYSIGG